MYVLYTYCMLQHQLFSVLEKKFTFFKEKGQPSSGFMFLIKILFNFFSSGSVEKRGRQFNGSNYFSDLFRQT